MSETEVMDLIEREAESIAKAIVAEWRAIAESEVWLALPPNMSFDDLPNVLRSIVKASLRPRFETELCAEILHYSSLHGDHRHTEGFQEHFIYTEYHLLRRSLWNFLRDRLAHDAAVTVIARVDVAISLATAAGIRGFHCQTFAKRGDWPAALERLLVEWPMLGA